MILEILQVIELYVERRCILSLGVCVSRLKRVCFPKWRVCFPNLSVQNLDLSTFLPTIIRTCVIPDLLCVFPDNMLA